MRYWFSVQLKIDMDGKVTEITYDLTYILYNNQTVVNTYNKGDNINPLLTPSTRTGYTFDGWYDDNTYTNRVTQITNISADTTLFGKWTAITYTISYNLDGGSLPNGTTNPNNYTIETPTFTLNNPTKTGNTFNGWTGTDLNQATSTVTISQGSTGNRTFTANWTPNTYNITYRDQGDTTYTGENSSSLISSYTYGTGIQQLVDGTKTGYTFDGWYDNSSCTGTVVTSISSTETGNKTLYAKWTQAQPTTGTIVNLRAGDKIIYVDANGNNIPCTILYDSTSSYGIQAISDSIVDTFSIGNGSSSGDGVSQNSGQSTNANSLTTAETSYINARSNLNTKARSYVNTALSPANGARIVGTPPDNPDIVNEYLTNAAYAAGNNIGPKTDTYYTTDLNQMTQLNIASISSGYWLGSYYTWPGSSSVTFYVRIVRANTSTAYAQHTSVSNLIFRIAASSQSYKRIYGVRPVFTLLNTLNVQNNNGVYSIITP